MKRKIIVCLIFFLSLYSFSQQKELIEIETKNTSVIIGVEQNQPVNILHWGKRIDAEKEFDTLQQQKQYLGHLYPTYVNHSLISSLELVQHDGVLTTELVYSGMQQKQIDENIVETIIMLKDKIYPIEVKIKFIAYINEDIITQSVSIINKGNKPVKIEKAASSYLPIHANTTFLTHYSGSWAKEMQMNEEKLTPGTKVIESRKGVRTTQCESPLFLLSIDKPVNEDSGDVYGGALAWSGNFKLEFQIDETGILHINSGTNTFFATHHLQAGGLYETPSMILSYSDCGKGQISRNFHNWTRRYNLAHGDSPRSILLNSWEGAYFDFDEKKITDMIDNAASLGIEMFVLDDGWFGNAYPRNNDKAGLGDWQVNIAKLPNGISYLANYATEKGLKFGIWIEPEMVNPDSELAKKHPDWIVKSGERSIPQQRNQWLLDLSNPAVQDFVFNTFDQVVSLSPNISYIKWDANRHVNNMGSMYLPADKQTHFWYEYVQGLYRVYDRIRAKYPDIEVQACASGGGRIDFGSLKYHDEFWTSDNTNALSRIFIQDGVSTFFPAMAMASHVSTSPNHQTGMALPLKFRFDVAMTGRLGFELQPKDIDSTDRIHVQEAVNAYKKIRPVVQLGELYRLISPYNDSGWSSLMYVSKNKSEAVFFAYSLDYHPFDRLKTKLKGIDPKKQYRLTELNKWGQKSKFYGDGKIFSGEFLINHGIKLNINRPYDSIILLLEEVNSGMVNPEKINNLVSFWNFQEKEGDKRISQSDYKYELREGNSPIERIGDGIFGDYSAKIEEGQWFYIPRAECPALNISGKNAQVTVVAWIKRGVKKFSQCEAIAGIWNETEKKRQYCLFLDLRIWESSQQVGGHISGVGGATDNYKYCMDAAIGKNAVPYDEWQCVAFSYDGKKISAFLNGELDERPTQNPYAYDLGIFEGKENGADFTVGAVDRSGEIGNFFVGQIGGLAVYNRALTSDEIRYLAKNIIKK